RSRTCDRIADHPHLQIGIRAVEIRLRGSVDRRAVRPARDPDAGRQSRRGRQCRRGGKGLVARNAQILFGARHLTLTAISFAMLVPFYWVIRTAITNENIYAYPPSLL